MSRIGGREGEGYISPDVQREAISTYGQELGGQIVAWHDDQDYSGKNLERPGFQAMLGRLEAGESDGMITMKIDRFSRSTSDGLQIVKGILERDQIFASCHERIDPRTKEGRYMLRQFLSNAEYFLDQVSEGWDTAKARAIANGKHIGPTPIGYLKVDPIPSKPTHISPVDSAAIGGPTLPGVLVPSPEYGKPMSDLFKRAASTRDSDHALSRWMTKTAPRENGTPWHSHEIRRWLSNRIYLGEVKYGGLVNDEAHAPLADEEIWEACQKAPGIHRRAPTPFLLQGLLRCASCRYALTGQTQGGRLGSSPIYRCHRASKGCPGPSVIVARRIERFLVDLVEEKQQGLLLGEVDAGEGADAIRDFDSAEAEVQAFAADLEARRLLGEEGWKEALRLRVDARESARPGRDAALARQAARKFAQVKASELPPDDLRDLLRGMIRVVFVRRARGVPPSERTLVIWSDDLRDIPVPGPHNKLTFEPIRW